MVIHETGELDETRCKNWITGYNTHHSPEGERGHAEAFVQRQRGEARGQRVDIEHGATAALGAAREALNLAQRYLELCRRHAICACVRQVLKETTESGSSQWAPIRAINKSVCREYFLF